MVFELLVFLIVTSFIAAGQNEFFSDLLDNFTKPNFTYPGTKWCGLGNNAKNYDDLGAFEEADKCCRDHDNCPDIIESGQTKHGLTNDSPYTRLHCDCDLRFESCLKNNSDVTSKQIKFIYFNLINQRCFKEDYPSLKCKEYYQCFNTPTTRCKEYEKNTTARKAFMYRAIPPDCLNDTRSSFNV